MDELQFGVPNLPAAMPSMVVRPGLTVTLGELMLKTQPQNTGGTNVSPDQRLGDREIHGAVTEGEQRGGFEINTRREKMRGDA